MVFPIGAHIREIAADHLDRLPGKSLVDGLIHERSVAENSHARGTNEPQQRRDGRRNQTEGNGDDEKTSVELGRRCVEGADLKVAAVEQTNEVHAGDHEDDIKEQERVGDQSIDAQHRENDGIVGRVVAQIVVNAGLNLGKVGRLVQALEIEELADGAEVAEAAAQGTRGEAREAITKVDARGNGIDRNLNARHDVGRE